MLDEYMTLREVAVMLRLNYWTVREHAENGVIPAKKIGGAWRISRSELERWIKGREVNG